MKPPVVDEQVAGAVLACISDVAHLYEGRSSALAVSARSRCVLDRWGHGQGTVTMSSTLSVSQALRDMGYDPEVQLVKVAAIPVPSAEIARALQLGDNDTVVFVQRNFVVHGQCMAVSRSFLPNRMVEGIFDRPLEDDSVQKTLTQRYGIRDEECQRWIEAVRATDNDAELLRIEVGSPLILLTRLFFDYKA